MADFAHQILAWMASRLFALAALPDEVADILGLLEPETNQITPPTPKQGVTHHG